MDFYNLSKGLHWAQKGVYFCFAIALILIPFDAYFLPLKTGPLTIYPYLLSIVSGVFISFFIPGESNKLPLLFKALFAVISIWVIVTLLLLFKVQDKHRAIYAVRSILFLWLHVVFFIRVWKYMPSHHLYKWILSALKVMLFFLIVCGFFEYFTGIHLVGAQTVKILHEPISDFTYAPMAYYDNPNNFMVYLISTILLLLYLQPSLRRNNAFFLLTTLLIFFFAEVADSKFGILISFFLLVFLILNHLKLWWDKYRVYLVASVISFIIGFICFVSNPLFVGPMWKWNNQYTLNDISSAQINPQTKRLTFISGDSLAKIVPIDTVVRNYRAFKGKYALNANQIRVNLNKNSFDLIKLSYGLGIGPGQYSWYYEHGLTKYPTTTVTNPHNAFAEITVEYGFVIILLLLALIFYWFKIAASFALERKDYETLVWLVLISIILVCVFNIPSAFLNLNIGWWLLILLIAGPYLNLTENTNRNE